MTPQTKNDSDNLCPCERYILDKAKKLHSSFCYLDFVDRYKHGTIRNAFASLKKKGKIALKARSTFAFFVLPPWDENLPIPRSQRKITSSPMEVDGFRYHVLKVDLMGFLESCTWEDVRHVHDIRLEFKCPGMWEVVSKAGGKWSEPHPVSLDVRHRPLRWCEGREALITVHHSDRVTVLVSCSKLPVEVSTNSMMSLVAFLGEIRQVLSRSGISIPLVSAWTITSWHYGRDGVPVQELAGKGFTVTAFDEWTDTYLRLYLNKVTEKARIEAVERLGKPFSRAIEEKLAPDLVLFKYAERILELLERQNKHDAAHRVGTPEASHITADSLAERHCGKENLESEVTHE